MTNRSGFEVERSASCRVGVAGRRRFFTVLSIFVRASQVKSAAEHLKRLRSHRVQELNEGFNLRRYKNVKKPDSLGSVS